MYAPGLRISRCRFSLAGFAAAAVLATTLSAQCETPAVKSVQTVGPGITWTHESFTSGPLNFNILEADLSLPGVTIEAESGKGRLAAGEKVAATVARETEPGKTRIVAGVNADFWVNKPRLYTPDAMLVSDGMIYTMPHKNSAGFLMTEDEHVYIGDVSMKVTLKSGVKSLKIDSINTNPSTSSVVLFTPAFERNIAPLAGGLRVVLTLDKPEFLPNKPVRVMCRVIDSAAKTPSVANQIIVSIPPSQANKFGWLKSVSSAELSAVVPQVKGVLTVAVGGKPVLVHNGQVVASLHSKGVAQSFVTTRHPRTAAGMSRDGKKLILVTVDGRQPKISIGMDLISLAHFMHDIGCWDAINFDGGGSTTMVVDGKVANKPSDLGGPRTVSDALLVVAKVGTGQLRSLRVSPEGSPLVVPAGVPLRVTIQGVDDSGAAVPLPAGQQMHISTGGVITSAKFVGQDAILETSKTPASGKVEFSVGDAKGSLDLTVANADVFSVEPDVLLLDRGESDALEVSATGRGMDMLIQPGMIQAQVASGSGVSLDQTTVTATQQGSADIRVQVGNKAANVKAFVDEARHVTIEGFDDVTALQQITGTHFNAAKTNVTLNTADKTEGAGSADVSYSMARGGSTWIKIPINAHLSTAPGKLNLAIRGDAHEEWVRSEIVDAQGSEFIADFTDGSKGIYWNDEWKQISIPFSSISPVKGSPEMTPKFPVTIKNLEIGQDQEVLKVDGKIGLDGFVALYPPMEKQ